MLGAGLFGPVALRVFLLAILPLATELGSALSLLTKLCGREGILRALVQSDLVGPNTGC